MNHLQKNEYIKWLQDIKKKISALRIKMALSANQELINLYWFLGSQIVEKQKTATWGSSFIDQFSKDLKTEFQDVAGFSPKNLRYCRAFYNFYADSAIWQQHVAKLNNTLENEKWQRPVAKTDSSTHNEIIVLTGQIPWGHNIHIFTKAKSFAEALFYINQTLANGWSRDNLGIDFEEKAFYDILKQLCKNATSLIQKIK